jgi:protein-disulfide isomerase
MAKVAPGRTPPPRRTQQAARGQARKGRNTNWLLLGGLIAVGVIGLFALLFLSLNQPGGQAEDEPAEEIIADYCDRNPDRCVFRGSADAPVTIVEVSDYGCSHCRNFNLSTAQTLDEMYVATDEVRWISLPYALGPTTATAAEAAMCAQEQDGYWELHRALFEQQGSDVALTRAGYLQAADEVGLDAEELASCLDDGRYTETVQNNVTIASQAGVTGTPTFFVNGRTLSGNRPLSDFQNAIAAAQES